MADVPWTLRDVPVNVGFGETYAYEDAFLSMSPVSQLASSPAGGLFLGPAVGDGPISLV